MFVLACSRVKRRQNPANGRASAAFEAFILDSSTDDEEPPMGMQGVQKGLRYVCICTRMCACVLVCACGCLCGWVRVCSVCVCMFMCVGVNVGV